MTTHENKRRTRKNKHSKPQQNTDKLMSGLMLIGQMIVNGVVKWLIELLISFL